MSLLVWARRARAGPYVGRSFSADAVPVPRATIHWHLKKTGETVTVSAKHGANLMRLAQKHDIPLEGACEGVVACSTCHVVLEDGVFDALPEAAEKEDDMLDQAFGLTATSRLACQIVVDEKLDGATVRLVQQEAAPEQAPVGDAARGDAQLLRRRARAKAALIIS